MKRNLLRLLFLLSLGLFLFSFRNSKPEECCLPKEQYKNKEWYQSFLFELKKENRIDSLDATKIKNTVSSSDKDKESTERIIEQEGKIQEEDLLLICSVKQNKDSLIYAVTQTNVYCHLFTYDIKGNKLTRVENKGSIVVTGGENLHLKEYNDTSVVFYTQSLQPENYRGWYKYFYFSNRTNTLSHYKNCKMTNNKEECLVIGM